MDTLYPIDKAPYSIGWAVDQRGCDDFYVVSKNHEPIGGPRTLGSAREELQRIEQSGLAVVFPGAGEERMIPDRMYGGESVEWRWY